MRATERSVKTRLRPDHDSGAREAAALFILPIPTPTSSAPGAAAHRSSGARRGNAAVFLITPLADLANM